MTLTFFTNFLEHHKAPLADEFYKLLGDDFKLVENEVMPISFKNSGYPHFSDKPYLIQAYKNKAQQDKANKLYLESDVVITGGIINEFLIDRIKLNKPIFRYCERTFKDGYYHLLSPRALLNYYKVHTKFRNKNVYALCASAYAAYDFSLLRAYPNKCYKWGYFTKVEEIDIEKIVQRKDNNQIKIFWVARFIDWKHPELPVKLAQKLKSKGYDFHINMAGSGDLFNIVKDLIHDLDVDDCVSLIGNLQNDEINDMMKQSHIFLVTSDRNEGWGAVLNEAMSNGCAVVASNMIGAAPYLVENEKNGFLFKSGDLHSLTEQVESLVNDESLRVRLSIQAYHTMKNVWSPKNAANNFLNLSEALLKGSSYDIEEGPCSKANLLNVLKIN